MSIKERIKKSAVAGAFVAGVGVGGAGVNMVINPDIPRDATMQLQTVADHDSTDARGDKMTIYRTDTVYTIKRIQPMGE